VTAQLLTGRRAPWLATSAGSIALAAGILLIVVADATGSTASYLAGSIIGGAGFGAAFLGGLRALVSQIPPLESTFEIFGSIVAAIGLVVAFLVWRTRPVAQAEEEAELLELSA
jgi:hypothetical protein